MTIQYASDLHLEFPLNEQYLRKHPLEAVADVLVLAGDVMPLSMMDRFKAFLDDLSARWKMVLWVPGNHEYYGGDLRKSPESFDLAIRDNVVLTQNTGFYLNDVYFVCSTLWSAINPVNQGFIRQRLSDFRSIRYGRNMLSTDRYNLMHLVCLQHLKDLIQTDHKGPTVVVTHHVPTLRHYPKEFKGDALNEAFASEQYALIKAYDADAWIYGHHHRNTPDFRIGHTRMLTNQLGYVQLNEHGSFVHDKVLTVNSKQ